MKEVLTLAGFAMVWTMDVFIGVALLSTGYYWWYALSLLFGAVIWATGMSIHDKWYVRRNQW